MSGVAPPSDITNYYIYKPVHGAPIAFAVLFGISGCLHIWQNNLHYKSYRIGFLLPWAAFLFVAGFILREYGSYHTDNLPIFITSTVLIFVAPPVYNGANYFIFGRMLYYLPYISPIHPGRVWSTFITLDAIADVIAGNGASRAANAGADAATREAGIDLVKVSLFMLIVMFIFFIFLNIQFHLRALRARVLTPPLRTVLYTLYISNLLILLRTTFRTATIFFPYTHPINAQEWYLYVFEVAPMLLNTYMLNVFPPAKFLPADHKVYLAVDGKTEMMGPGMVDKRRWWVTVVDPFDCVGLARGRDSKERFWERDGIGGPKVEGREGETSVVGVQGAKA